MHQFQFVNYLLSYPILGIKTEENHFIFIMSVAVPPGLYQVQVTSNTSQKVAGPASAGGNITVNTSTAQWQITGDGVITSFQTGSSATQARTPNVPAISGNNVVADAGTIAQQWIISGANLISNTYWTGYVMTSDGTQLFWGVDGSNNALLATSIHKG
ncbi:hypothetical protein C8R41DRAFT_490674 [Lentinula lateritia]|uniref:Uncharacterized protein n=1 Tax=Lentinula lateritia TaxID=40482 RepID=A0ABQ8VC69_9AGAR|nr:hypothetical protein C8R41DRAFT_490674 [Lentinula lateritia]